MLNDQVVFIGAGQCGGNIGNSLQQKGCNSFYINSAIEDLEYINADDSRKYHIQGAKGAAKNKEIAKDIISNPDEKDSICWKIHSEFANCKYITFGFSGGGGTGGTISMDLAENMVELYPEKIVNFVCVLPSANEDIIAQINALDTLEDIKRLYDNKTINNIQFLDNNKGDFKRINENFAISFSNFLNFENIDSNGNFDTEEQIQIMANDGAMVIYDFAGEDFMGALIDESANNVYFKAPKLSNMTGIVANKNFKDNEIIDSVREVVGFAKVDYKSKWEEESNMVIASGIDFETQYKLIKNHLNKQMAEIQNAMNKSKEEALKELENENTDDIDISSIINQNKLVNNRNRRERNSSGRVGRRRSTSKIREKYRSL